jgi:hypothetical protein
LSFDVLINVVLYCLLFAVCFNHYLTVEYNASSEKKMLTQGGYVSQDEPSGAFKSFERSSADICGGIIYDGRHITAFAIAQRNRR